MAKIARVPRSGGVLLFEEVPGRTQDSRVFRASTDHPRADRFEPEELADAFVRIIGGRTAARVSLGAGLAAVLLATGCS